MRLRGTTPAAPDDSGGCDPALATALESGDDDAVKLAMLRARLLVPVVAASVEAGDADMSVPALVADDGRRALPVFSSHDALRLWRADARPVPMAGARVLAGAVAERYDGVVLDVAGPAPHTVTGVDLVTMGRAASALLDNRSAEISVID